MKKLYILALAGVMALGATATERRQAANITRNTITVKAPVTAEAKTGRVNPLTTPAPAKGPAKAAPIADVAALNGWSAYGHLEGQGGVIDYDLAVTVDDAATGAVSLLLGKSFKLSATYNAMLGTLTIPTDQYLGSDADGEIRFYVKTFDENGDPAPGAAAVTSVSAPFINGKVTFNQDQLWAFGDPNNEAVGFYCLTSQNAFYTETLISLGKGSFVENLVYPYFTGKENTTAAEVEVLTDGNGHYIVKEAFQTLFKTLGAPAGTVSPDMTLDAPDPANVLLPTTFTGLTDENLGSMFVYGEGWFYDTYLGGLDFDPALAITMTVKDDIATVIFPVDCCTIMGNESMEYFPGSEYVSTLTFDLSNSGIANVAIDNNAPVTYYNLQGVRVDKPTTGLYIRRQGNTATKVMVK